MISKSYFSTHTGHKPENDDLERCNCQKQGRDGHDCCGWNFDVNLPIFIARKPEKEIIQCVAFRYHKPDCDEKIIWAPRPNRHHHLVYWYGSLIRNWRCIDMYDEIQGFLTNSGRFVDRHEGLKIAERENQILTKTQPEYKLFSEDMW